MASLIGRTLTRLKDVFGYGDEARAGRIVLDPILLTQKVDDWRSYLTGAETLRLCDGESAAGVATMEFTNVAVGTSMPLVPNDHIRVILACEAWHNDPANRRLQIQISYHGLTWVTIVTDNSAPPQTRLHLPLGYLWPGPRTDATFSDNVSMRVAVNSIAAGSKVAAHVYAVDVPVGSL